MKRIKLNRHPDIDGILLISSILTGEKMNVNKYKYFVKYPVNHQLLSKSQYGIISVTSLTIRVVCSSTCGLYVCLCVCVFMFLCARVCQCLFVCLFGCWFVFVCLLACFGPYACACVQHERICVSVRLSTSFILSDVSVCELFGQNSLVSVHMFLL